MTQRYFFCHMQKTGGISLSRRLRVGLGHQAVYPSDTDGPMPQRTISVPHLLDRWAERRQEIVVVCGHFPLCTVELLDEQFISFTLLRDPVDRVMSSLKHQHRAVARQADRTLEQIYDDPMLRALLMTNHMTKMLSLETSELDENGDAMYTDVAFDDTRLAKAEARLESFDLIGFQDDFEGFCSKLEQRYGWDLGPPLRLNSSPDDGNDHTELRSRIAEDNRHDAALVAAARRLVEDRERPS